MRGRLFLSQNHGTTQHVRCEVSPKPARVDKGITGGFSNLKGFSMLIFFVNLTTFEKRAEEKSL